MQLICVIGAGPSGCAAAHRLASLGYQCMLLARRNDTRRLESISPGAFHFLQMMGAADDLKSIADSAQSTSLRWASEHIERRPSDSVLVDRSQLDSLLLQAAISAGAHYFEVDAVERPVPYQEGWHVRASVKTHKLAWNSAYVVIATGRRPLTASSRQRTLPRLLALCGEWKVQRVVDGMVVEALPDGWVWAATSRNGRCSAIAFVDPANDGRGVRERYLACVQSSSLVSAYVGDAKLESLRACDASAQCALQPLGENYIHVGESALCMEPISSQGVQMALKLGFQGAIVAHNSVKVGNDAELARLFYESQISTTAARHQQAALKYYAESTRFAKEAFWQRRRASTETPDDHRAVIGHSPQACLIGDHFELREAPVCHPQR